MKWLLTFSIINTLLTGAFFMLDLPLLAFGWLIGNALGVYSLYHLGVDNDDK